MYEDLIKSLKKTSMNLGESDTVSVLLLEAANAIEELQKAVMRLEDESGLYDELPTYYIYPAKWIPVSERLPENEVQVLVVRRFLGVKDCPPKTYVEMAEYCYGDWIADSDEYKIARNRHTDPIYWMPLPEPPKEEI